jgi:hypothetical protein
LATSRRCQRQDLEVLKICVEKLTILRLGC